MSSRISTILILGATRGIGEALARRFHAMGKKVIITGRERDEDKMQLLVNEMPGLEFRVETAKITPSQWDLTDLHLLQSHVTSILQEWPDLDTLFLNAAIQSHYNIFTSSPAAPSLSGMMAEFTTNLVAPILVAQAFAPHLLGRAKQGRETTLFITTSSLAYFPVPFYPGYCAAKAGLASFVKILRMQTQALQLEEDEGRERDERSEKLGGMKIIEVVPPYVDTALNAEHRAQTDALQGGEERAVQPMALGEYVDGFFEGLEEGEEEIAVGFAKKGVEVWKRGFWELRRRSGME
ncbi:MAG: hypothetical protein Q9204_003479 [Flavoplaca sp. TL-2023a]